MKRFSEIYSRPSGRTKALLLLIATLVVLMVPNIVLIFTEHYGFWSALSGVVLPLGFYMILGAFLRRTGIPVLLLTWAMVLCALQIVLLYLFGNSIIATDMFINILTTNPGEATELLDNISPIVAVVSFIYGPVIAYAIFAIHRRYRITHQVRRVFVSMGVVLIVVGHLALWPAKRSEGKGVFLDEVFPANVLYNFHLCLWEQHSTLDYLNTSEDFTYNAARESNPKRREIYVYMIGEASRASSWQLYGYDRATNPLLSKREDIVVFKNVLTQSNTTHKSVPLFLSSVGATNRAELFQRKGLAALFSEVGFKTYFISNQSPQGAMIDLLANEADERIYIGAPRYDMQLLVMMKRIIESENDDADLLFILHCYGSHFSYKERYPHDEAVFLPDEDVRIVSENVASLANAYDNSIVYTDRVINSIIDYVDSLDACVAVLYCSDHGEDMLDDKRGRFLHASPTVTYYQIHVPSLLWLSDDYIARYPEKLEAAREHDTTPITTYSMFHTIADLASIRSEYVKEDVSLVSKTFDTTAPRYYLDDHNNAVPFDEEIGLNSDDMKMFAKHGIVLK